MVIDWSVSCVTFICMLLASAAEERERESEGWLCVWLMPSQLYILYLGVKGWERERERERE